MAKKIPQTKTDLEMHLDEQIKFLMASNASFDAGFDGEAKRLALTMRVLLHDTKVSTSLLEQVDKKQLPFVDTTFEYDPHQIHPKYSGLIIIEMGSPEKKYVAPLDDVPEIRVKSFQEWWNQTVFIDDHGNSISRRDLILAVANQDGGGHVDPKIDEKYARLSRENSPGWMVGGPSGYVPLEGPERAAIRQISHEVLKTLVPGYKMKRKPKGVLSIGGITLTTTKTDDANSKIKKTGFNRGSKKRKIGRNEPCPCGSGKKYKKCCL